MKTSKVTKAEFKKEFDSNYGKLYSFLVEFENGDSGFYNSKNKDNPKFTVGKEADYTVEEKQGNKGSYNIIKPVKKDFTTTYDKGSSKGGNASFALSYAKDYYIACCNHIDPKTDADTICEVAEIFKNWLDKN